MAPSRKVYITPISFFFFCRFHLTTTTTSVICVAYGNHDHDVHQKRPGRIGSAGQSGSREARHLDERVYFGCDRAGSAIERLNRKGKHLMAAVCLSPLAASGCSRAAWRGRASESSCSSEHESSREAAGVSLQVPSHSVLVVLKRNTKYTLSAPNYFLDSNVTREYCPPSCVLVLKGDIHDPPARSTCTSPVFARLFRCFQGRSTVEAVRRGTEVSPRDYCPHQPARRDPGVDVGCSVATRTATEFRRGLA